jgi:4-hydroxythreonine-4-phosphate dehydrogenase
VLPVIALAIGDPAGVGPELAAKLVADPDIRAAMALVIVGDRRVLERGAADSSCILDIDVRGPDDSVVSAGKPVLIDLGNLDPATIDRGVAAEAGGRSALANFSTCLRIAAAAGKADAVCFTPFNKAAMRLSHPSYDDE